MKTAHQTFYGMGTRLDVLMSEGLNFPDEIFDSIALELKRLEKLLSKFDPESKISKIAGSAYNNEVKLDDELWQIFSECKKYYELTNGAFDITSSPLIEQMKLSSNSKETTIDSVTEYCGFEKIIFNESDKSIKFSHPKLTLDFGALGKGYAIEKIADILRRNKIETALLNFGNSSVYAIGSHPYGNYWPIGIQNIFNEKEIVYEFQLKDSALSTSGPKSTVQNGTRSFNNHIMDPRDCRIVNQIKTLSVKCNSSLHAEILSTAFFAMNREEINNCLSSFNNCDVVEISYTDEKNYSVEKINN